ncbi:MAG: hypothetical protein QN193_03260 [Armatimonadota bacterium]|nr:hypothetical protein [Armatimonadota bacterium]MDR7443122.1 hypothetical protein [Armatimonadota bacterium]MDR7569607.1 hypothetical protein [Armatimonadota bacterium]MDR7614661.1 hypothetical protein [Armatimonadota bacterium]
MAGWALRAMGVVVSLAALGPLVDPHGHDPYHAHVVLGGDPETRQRLVHPHGPHPASHAHGPFVISLRALEPASAATLHLVGGVGVAGVLGEVPVPAVSRSHGVWNFLPPYDVFLNPPEPPPRSA